MEGIKKKKILFCLQTMVLGGVEKELITVLKRMSPEEYDISLVLLYISDERIIKQIPSYVNIIVLNVDKNYYCSSLVNLCKARIKRGHFIQAISLLIKRVLCIGTTHTNTNISKIPAQDELYDIAICYHIHSPISLRYVAEKTVSNKKIAWIHNDFFNTKFPVVRLKKYLDNYDEIIAVSRTVELEFLQLCPEYKEKTYMVHNIVDYEEIIQKSRETINDASYINVSVPKLLTVGRFTNQKGFDIAIRTASVLKSKNIDFKWFFIGCGEQESEYLRLISELNVHNNVIVLGRKDNPYPYIKDCDIYVQPSRHEAYAMVILEAKVLNKPIVCSRFAGADEQIKNGVTGLIVSVNNVEELTDAIVDLLTNAQKRKQFEMSLSLEKSEGWNTIKMHL